MSISQKLVFWVIMHNARLHLCMHVCVCVRIRISVVTTQPRSLLSQYVCVKYKFAEITHRDRHIFDSSCGNSQGHRSQICSESNQSNEYSTADAHPITARDSGFFFFGPCLTLCASVPICVCLFSVCFLGFSRFCASTCDTYIYEVHRNCIQ